MDIKQKLKRLRNGASPKILDIFSGCGGLSVGLKLAGFTPVGGLDIDAGAMDSWWYNLRPDLAGGLKAAPSFDITAIDPTDFFNRLSIPKEDRSIDVLCGGPPCQAYSRIGKAKLRSLGGAKADLEDARGELYQEFLRFVRVLQPLVILMENVPDSLNYGGRSIPDEVCEALSGRKYGYRANWTILNAARYGVPQFRERVILLAFHESLGIDPSFPSPTNSIKESSNTRKRTKGLSPNDGKKADQAVGRFYIAPGVPKGSVPEAITVEEALGDLPRICALDSLKSNRPPGSADLAQILPYAAVETEIPYQRLMRHWPGFETRKWVSGNMVRNTARDFPIFARMVEGDKYPEALKIAESLLLDRIKAEEAKLGRKLTKPELKKARSLTVPPYSDDKFEEKWLMLHRNRPSHTVVAHLQRDTYSHIHYDVSQARAISVREAARLQSFPDGFRFHGAIGNAFEQIGNAVPPLVAASIGTHIAGLMRAPSSTGVARGSHSMVTMPSH